MNEIKKYILCQQRCDSTIELHTCLGGVTHSAIEVWFKLPVKIRQDLAFAQFQLEYDRIRALNNEIISHGTHPLASKSTTINMKSGRADGSAKRIDQTRRNYATFSDCRRSSGSVNDAKSKRSSQVMSNIKIAVLITVWMLFTGILMLSDEKVLKYHQLTIPANDIKSFVLNEIPTEPRFALMLIGAFADDSSNTTNFLSVQTRLVHDHVDDNNSISSYTSYHNEIFKIPIDENLNATDAAREIKKTHTFYLDANMFEQIGWNDTTLSIQIKSNLAVCFSVSMAYDSAPIDKSVGIIYAAGILFALYAMIIWEVIDRTFAAMLASTFAIAVLALMNDRPTMPEISSWIDVETLLLLFGMMVLVGILSETGFFDYLAVFAFKVAGGRIWTLIYCLCLFTAFLSAILDNVTTLLLMAPVSIRLCEIVKLNPIPILTSMIIFSNIGGCMTPVGDPPNIIIASNSHVIRSGVNFLNFAIHMSTGAIFVMIQTFIQLRLKFRTVNDLRVGEPQDIRQLRDDIAAWQRAATMLSPSSRDEGIVRSILMNKIMCLQRELKDKLTDGLIPSDVFHQTLVELQEKYSIRNVALLIKSAIALTFVITCFFFHSLPYIQRLSLGWTALLGVILLLILADRKDIESILAHVEWSTLLFFAVLFVLMESLAKLGLIAWIGDQTQHVILSVSEESRLAVAILIILWISGIASAFVDNIPLTTMMIRVTISLSENTLLNLPLQPLIWALSFGACLGGNGTLIGASANIVCASVAEQNGYRLTFMEYFKVAFPAMIGSLFIASGYLLVCYVGFG